MSHLKERTLDNTDLSEYKGDWIAYEPDSRRIVGTGESLKIVKQVAAKKGVKKYILMEVPKSGTPFAGYSITNS